MLILYGDIDFKDTHDNTTGWLRPVTFIFYQMLILLSSMLTM